MGLGREGLKQHNKPLWVGISSKNVDCQKLLLGVLKTSEMLEAATTYQNNFSYDKKFKTVEDNACISIIKWTYPWK